MREFIATAKALSDESRVQALIALQDGELCLCQIVDLLGLAPSTVSKHMSLLYAAGLVERRKEGRWQYFRLVSRDASPTAREALRFIKRSLASETVSVAEAACCVREKQLDELTCCYGSPS